MSISQRPRHCKKCIQGYYIKIMLIWNILYLFPLGSRQRMRFKSFFFFNFFKKFKNFFWEFLMMNWKKKQYEKETTHRANSSPTRPVSEWHHLEANHDRAILEITKLINFVKKKKNCVALAQSPKPIFPTVAFSQLSSNICCPRDCVSRTANVERNGG